MVEVLVSAPGKVTLFGEHAIVYGEPAIVTAISRRLYVKAEPRSDKNLKISAMDLKIPGVILTFVSDTGELTLETDYGRVVSAVSYVKKAIELTANYVGEFRGVNIEVRSSMPVGAGLGTSAAVAVATVAAYAYALGYELSKKEIAKLGHKTELEVQGAASPMDTSIATYGGTIYIKPEKPEPIIEHLKLTEEYPLVIGYVERKNTTKELVAKVRKLKEKKPEIIMPIIRLIGVLTEDAKKALISGDVVELGELMNINHGLLDALGVSTKELNDLVYAARQAGALGSKLTGAGGGGCMIALAPGRVAEVSTAIDILGGQPMDAKMSAEGLTVEVKK
ncbi:MAG: mevalonate kinase [Thermoprotei archaeon]|nr:mevalonate kinase [Thermoprotei archaeon]